MNDKKRFGTGMALLALFGAVAITGCSLFGGDGATSGAGTVDLGKAGDYVVLAKTQIENMTTSAITGDLGLSPAATSYITGLALTDATGYATSAQVIGKVYAADMASPTSSNLTTAVSDMEAAYTDAATRTDPDFTNKGAGILGGLTLAPGLYTFNTSVTIPTDVTLSGGILDTWVFQISGDLSIASAMQVILSGGALARNVVWQVAGIVTLGSTSRFEGVILSQTAITLETGAVLHGRALAQSQVTLDGVTITAP